MMNKGVKGVSTIVSNVIIILLVIIGISFIMLIVFTIIQQGIKQIDLDTLTLNLEIEKASKLNDSFIGVQVKRNSGEGKLVGLAFVFFDGLESEIIEKEVKLEELQERIFVLELEEFNVNEIEEISIAPLLKGRQGEIITCNVEDRIDFS
jgi:hypothetical protein